jgi:hypothetical protein
LIVAAQEEKWIIGSVRTVGRNCVHVARVADCLLKLSDEPRPGEGHLVAGGEHKWLVQQRFEPIRVATRYLSAA